MASYSYVFGPREIQQPPHPIPHFKLQLCSRYFSPLYLSRLISDLDPNSRSKPLSGSGDPTRIDRNLVLVSLT